MAWNDPPSFDYQQISNSGRKFKHRYVLSDTNSKYGQSSPQFHQTPLSSNNNQFQHQPMTSIHQGQPQQPFHQDNSLPTQPLAPPTTYNNNNNNNDNGTVTSLPASSSSGINGSYQGFESSQFGPNGYATNDSSQNNFSNNQSMMYPNNQQQYQSPPPPPPQQMMPHQQQAFQPQ